MLFPFWPSGRNPNLIPPLHYTTYQPPLPTVGAIQVTNGTELAAAIAGATDGTTIEMTAAVEYALASVLLIPAGNVTINVMVAGAYISGSAILRALPGAGKTVTFTGVEFRNTATSSSTINGCVHQGNGNVVFSRCRFVPSGTLYSYCVYAIGDSTVFDACVAVDAATSRCWNLFATTVTVRNCLVDCQNSGAAGIRGGAGMTVHNTAVRTTGTCFANVGYTEDYCISTDATAVGANSHASVTWADYFDGDFLPQNETARVGGDVANAASVDYFGNSLASEAPIGAIIAD